MGDNHEGVDVEMGACQFFITLQSNYIYCMCMRKAKFLLLRFDCKIPIQVFKVLKHCIIGTVNHARFSLSLYSAKKLYHRYS